MHLVFAHASRPLFGRRRARRSRRGWFAHAADGARRRGRFTRRAHSPNRSRRRRRHLALARSSLLLGRVARRSIRRERRSRPLPLWLFCVRRRPLRLVRFRRRFLRRFRRLRHRARFFLFLLFRRLLRGRRLRLRGRLLRLGRRLLRRRRRHLLPLRFRREFDVTAQLQRRSIGHHLRVHRRRLRSRVLLRARSLRARVRLRAFPRQLPLHLLANLRRQRLRLPLRRAFVLFALRPVRLRSQPRLFPRLRLASRDSRVLVVLGRASRLGPRDGFFSFRRPLRRRARRLRRVHRRVVD
mmetsp:Transcript_2120/g.8277  ORF Transcript_2120/g.8277 Transcript_2120/m.8277 type:complete len:297 (-) Transcript_2120:3-893(-)